MEYNGSVKGVQLIANKARAVARRQKRNAFAAPLTLRFDSLYRTSFPVPRDSILMQSQGNARPRDQMHRKNHSTQRSRLKSRCNESAARSIQPLRGIPLIKKLSASSTQTRGNKLLQPDPKLSKSKGREFAIQTDFEGLDDNVEKRNEGYWDKYIEVANRYAVRIFKPMLVMKIENKGLSTWETKNLVRSNRRNSETCRTSLKHNRQIAEEGVEYKSLLYKITSKSNDGKRQIVNTAKSITENIKVNRECKIYASSSIERRPLCRYRERVDCTNRFGETTKVNSTSISGGPKYQKADYAGYKANNSAVMKYTPRKL
eukprot:TRINITY_DN9550_c0_g1_i16.p1 TRINITY_DN9550_c0_g1~~TRINITY_DN9550_c0_g1_i16.p1  ORF type:complete len:316 (-),score=14.12 TRINITY_DN9550_c0_g1_i16:93-1040(-)